MGRLLAFDSGIGGLSVVGALRAALPATPIDYLADTALFPYGEVPDEILTPRILSLIGAALERLRPDVVVVACNTASTVALAALRARYDIPFVGCVPPIKWAASLSRTRHIGLLATAATVRRPYLRDLQARFAPDCTLVAHGARGLADLAEAAFRGDPVDDGAIAAELGQLFGQPGGEQVDVVGLGCTHYPFLLDRLRALGPPDLVWLDPAPAVARQTATVLAATAGGADAGGAGSAWFTSVPAQEARLLPRLARFGFDAIRLFAEQPA